MLLQQQLSIVTIIHQFINEKVLPGFKFSSKRSEEKSISASSVGKGNKFWTLDDPPMIKLSKEFISLQ